VPRHVLLSLTVGATRSLVRALKAKEVPWIYSARPLYVGDVEGIPVGTIWAAPGAPLAAMVVEDLIACGAKLIIGIGLTAAVSPKIKVGDLIIPSIALRNEGTSRHYLPPRVQTVPDASILKKMEQCSQKLGVRYYVGPLLTSDAPYRETPSKIEYLERNGVLGIDMETSAIFSIAIYRRIMAGCILAASSNLALSRGPGFYAPSLRASVQNAIKVSTKVLKSISS
jgi:uridine phosphorylase